MAFVMCLSCVCHVFVMAFVMVFFMCLSWRLLCVCHVQCVWNVCHVFIMAFVDMAFVMMFVIYVCRVVYILALPKAQGFAQG